MKEIALMTMMFICTMVGSTGAYATTESHVLGKLSMVADLHSLLVGTCLNNKKSGSGDDDEDDTDDDNRKPASSP